MAETTGMVWLFAIIYRTLFLWMHILICGTSTLLAQTVHFAETYITSRWFCTAMHGTMSKLEVFRDDCPFLRFA